MAACSSASPTSADVSVPRVWPRCTKSSRTDGMVADADRWVEVPAAVTKDLSRGGVTRGWRHPDAGHPVSGLGFLGGGPARFRGGGSLPASGHCNDGFRGATRVTGGGAPPARSWPVGGWPG